jgi:hypothetical protein
VFSTYALEWSFTCRPHRRDGADGCAVSMAAPLRGFAALQFFPFAKHGFYSS